MLPCLKCQGSALFHDPFISEAFMPPKSVPLGNLTQYLPSSAILISLPFLPHSTPLDYSFGVQTLKKYLSRRFCLCDTDLLLITSDFFLLQMISIHCHSKAKVSLSQLSIQIYHINTPKKSLRDS